MSKEKLKPELLMETVVTCPECQHQNRLSKRASQGIYRCGNCSHDLPNPFLSLGQSFQAFPRRGFSVRKIMSIGILTALAGFSLFVFVRGCSSERPSSLSSASITSPSPSASPTLSSSIPKPKTTPKRKPKPIVRLLTNECGGVPYPTKTGYIKKCPASAIGGYSSVTVDNSKGGSDIFVKLFKLNVTPPKAASVFFIRAYDTFTVTDIQPGSYDVRYRELNSGVLVRTEQFNLEEIRTAEGVRFSRLRMTTYSVPEGNLHIQPISEDEF
jgi:hypothetical protein